MFDLLINGGTVIDGTGKPGEKLDVGITDGIIVKVGKDLQGARETVDATGKLVTPGFIDIHTHYDGQATWDSQMLPSSEHGVTTIVMGSCGIGFAPVRKGREDWLIRLMEGVEDIPGTALHEGITWGWESFPDYLDILEKKTYALNIAAHLPHSAARAYIMGDRAERDEEATPEDLEKLKALIIEAMEAGAVGVGTSRVNMHRASDGTPVPGTKAKREELMAMAEAIAEAGGGVFQLIPSGVNGGVEGDGTEGLLANTLPDQHLLTDEINMMRWLHQKTGVPVTFSFAETPVTGAIYEKAKAIVAEAHAAGEKIVPQYAPRANGAMTSLETYHVFMTRPTYKSLADLPLAERAQRMKEPAIRAAILSEQDEVNATGDPFQSLGETFRRNLHRIFSLADLDFEPEESKSIAAIAAAAGRTAEDVMYDMLIENDGSNVLIWMAANYETGDLQRVEQALDTEDYVLGLGDGGAHCRFICDASIPTFLLIHWGKTRTRGRRFPVEKLVYRVTKQPADLYGFHDRGHIAEGKRADLNVIDFEKLSIGVPYLKADLPTGAKRFLQDAHGIDLTVVNGVVTRRDDQDTGARSGRLLRRQTHKPDANNRISALATG